ncbi:MAG TPA: cytochrome c oxidase subunit II [Bacilli bacterium]
MNRWKNVGRLTGFLVTMALLLTGCDGVLDPKGPVAREQLQLINLSFIIMIVVLVIVFGLFFYVLVRFRKRKGQTGIPEQVEGNHKLEIIWTVIPFLLLVIIAVPTVLYTFKFATDYTNDKNAIHVKVTGHQFWWEFEYTDKDLGLITANELVIPVGKKIALELTSADTLHSFWVPQLGGKIDTNPGMINKMYLEADIAAIYQGKCAELCGASHALMNFKVIAKSEADFAAWASQMKAEAVITEEAKEGEAIFTAKCLSCHAVSSDDRGAYPNLDGYAYRTRVAGVHPNDPQAENLRKWLSDTDHVKPGNNMGNQGLTDVEINELIKYLHELK